VPVQIYSDGNLVDPTPDTDISHLWAGGSDLNGARVLAASFSVASRSLLENVSILTYDTTDANVGILTQVGYSIFSGGSAPTGTPIASGLGHILSSAILSGHSSLDGIGKDGHLHEVLQTIATSFDLTTPIDLNSGTRYWLVLSAVTDPSGVNNIAQWADSDLAGGFYLANGQMVTGGRAFDLNGEFIGVPDKASTLLLSVVSIFSFFLVTCGLKQPPNAGRNDN